MATFIGDVALPRDTWVRLSQGGPVSRFMTYNAGSATIEIKKAASQPQDAGGAMRMAAGSMYGPEDLTLHGLDVWGRSPIRDGLVSVEALAELTSFSTKVAQRIVPVTPDDQLPLPDGPCRALFVGGEGTVQIVDGADMLSTVVSGGSQYHPMVVKKILATGTTATFILALY